MHEALTARLEEDLFLNASTLKFLRLHPAEARGRLVARGGEWASLTWFPAALFAFDRGAYPLAQWVAFLNGPSLEGQASLLELLPPGPGILKLPKPLLWGSWSRGRSAEQVRDFWAYTTAQAPSHDPQDLEEHADLPPGLAELWASEGRDLKEVRRALETGGRCYLRRAKGQAVSGCYTQILHGRLWEVAGLITHPEHRRQGYGAQVAGRAVTRLLARGLSPRYFVDAANRPSVQLAEGLGLRRQSHLTHWRVP